MMTPITFDAPQVQALQPEAAIAYVKKKGWQPVPHPNHNIELFQGKADDSGQPIQLVLPKHSDLWDSSILLAKAINLLAAIEEKSPQEILTAIQSGAAEDSEKEYRTRKASSELVTSPLRGKALLEKVKELSNLPQREIAKRTGYYTTTKSNRLRLKLTEFYEAILAARETSLSSKNQEISQQFEPSYRVKVNKNGEIIIGAFHTQAIGLKPGDEFEVRLGYKHIHLLQVQHEDVEQMV